MIKERRFCYNEPSEDFTKDLLFTFTETELREVHYPKFLKRIEAKFGTDRSCTFEEFLDHWMVVNWAWELKEDEQKTTD